MSRQQNSAHAHATTGHEWQHRTDRIVMLLRFAAHEIRPCRRCGAELYFVNEGKSKRTVAFTRDGVPHGLNCPNAQKTAEQATLIDTSPLPD